MSLHLDSVPRFSFHRLPRGTGDPHLVDAYRCWREVWLDTLAELDGSAALYSDDFTRQDEIDALFYEDICVGLTGCRFLDLSSPLARDDSYFKVWPGSALDALAAAGAQVCIGNNMTVRREWRGRIAGISVKRLLLILSIHRFLASSAAALGGTMRNGRGMDRLGYELGFRPIVRGAIHHGVAVDLVGYFRRSEPRLAPELSSEHELASALFEGSTPSPEPIL